MRYTILALFGILAITAGVFALAGGGTARAADQTVEVGNFYFCSSAQSGQVCTTNVTAGDTVTWSVASGSHTVTQCTDAALTSCGSGFNSQLPGGTFAQTFNTAETIYYRCEFHPTDMKGSIVVAAAAASATPTGAPTSPGSTAAVTARPSVAAAPNTGGPSSGDASTPTWAYLLLALGGIAIGASAATYALSRRTI